MRMEKERSRREEMRKEEKATETASKAMEQGCRWVRSVERIKSKRGN